jgi:DNA mismatch repair protein MLH1
MCLDEQELSMNGSDLEEGEKVIELRAEAQTVWAQREWTIQHILFPAMKLFLKPPNHLANDGSVIQIACLENLYKIFERC